MFDSARDLLLQDTYTVSNKRMHIKNIFPDVLKKAYVNPIYKKGEPQEAENYLTISVQPTLANIFERLLLQEMLEHVEKYEIINKNQFGF